MELETNREFVTNAFVLNEVFKDVMDEAGTDAITVNQCMGTIMGMSRTTACLPLSLLNDGGYLAFCESDFVVIPAGVLLHYTRAFAPGKDMVHKMNRIEDGRTFGVRLRTDPGPAVEAILPERKVRLT